MERKFKGVWIPKWLWLTKDLSLGEKVMLVELDSLDSSDRGCFASNAHLAAHFGLSDSRVSEIISSLREKGYISVDQVRQGVRVVQRTIRVLKSLEGPETSSENAEKVLRKTEEGSSEKAKGSNTERSNTEREQPIRRQQAADRIPYDEIKDLYNRICAPTFHKAQRMDKQRTANIKACWAFRHEGAYPFRSIDFWEKYFLTCLENPHWRGENDRGWKAHLEFVTRDTTVTRVLENRHAT